MAILWLKCHGKALINIRDIMAISCFNDHWLIIIWCLCWMFFLQIRISASGCTPKWCSKWMCFKQWQDLVQNAESKPKQLQMLALFRGIICRRKVEVFNCPTAQLYRELLWELHGRHGRHFNSRVSCLLWLRLEDGVEHPWFVARCFWEADSACR